MDPLHSEEYRGYTINVYQDEDALNPRTEWDNASVIWCFHRRYTLGDTGNPYKASDYSSWDELEAAIIKAEKPIALERVYLYDHSGLRFKIGSFNGLLPQGHAEFDSGCVGFIFVTRESYERCCGKVGRRVTKAIKAQAEKILRQDAHTYDDYLSGAVYGYVIEKNGDVEDSCSGYFLGEKENPFSDESCMIADAKGKIDALIKDRAAELRKSRKAERRQVELDLANTP